MKIKHEIFAKLVYNCKNENNQMVSKMVTGKLSSVKLEKVYTQDTSIPIVNLILVIDNSEYLLGKIESINFFTYNDTKDDLIKWELIKSNNSYKIDDYFCTDEIELYDYISKLLIIKNQ